MLPIFLGKITYDINNNKPIKLGSHTAIPQGIIPAVPKLVLVAMRRVDPPGDVAGTSQHICDVAAEERAAFRSIAMGEWKTVADGSENAKMVFDTLTGYLRENGLISE